jgi:hypothetical protein
MSTEFDANPQNVQEIVAITQKRAPAEADALLSLADG